MLRFIAVGSAFVNLALGGAPWPMFRRSAIHDAATDQEGPSSNKTAWIFKADGAIYNSPVIGNDVVFVGTYQTPKGTLYALDPSNGNVRWQFLAGGPIGSTPCVIEKLNQIVFGADDGFVYSIDMSSGAQVWRYRHTLFRKFVLASSPVYSESPNGVDRIFFGTSDSSGDILALKLNGKSKPSVLWTFSSGGSLTGVPGGCAFDQEEIFVGSNNGNVYALGADDGKVHWSTMTHGTVYSSPALSPDRRTVFVGSNDGTFYSLNRSSGAVMWELSTPGWVDSSAAVSDGNVVYIATSNSNSFDNYAAIYKLHSQTGDVLWQHDLSESEDGVYDPVIAGSRVYAGSVSNDQSSSSSGGSVWAWDAATGAELWRMDTHGHVGAAAAVGASGEMYIGDRVGWVYKFPGTAQENLLV